MQADANKATTLRAEEEAKTLQQKTEDDAVELAKVNKLIEETSPKPRPPAPQPAPQPLPQPPPQPRTPPPPTPLPQPLAPLAPLPARILPPHRPSEKGTVAEPCDSFELDVEGKFGTCTCGHLKQFHGDAKARKQAKKKIREGSSRGFVVEPMEQGGAGGDSACGNFKIDMTSAQVRAFSRVAQLPPRPFQ